MASNQASYAGGSVASTKHALLQDWREDQYSGAPNKIVPEVTDVGRREENENEYLRKERREKYGGPCDSTNEESGKEKTENTAVENRAQDVARFKQVFDQTRK